MYLATLNNVEMVRHVHTRCARCTLWYLFANRLNTEVNNVSFILYPVLNQLLRYVRVFHHRIWFPPAYHTSVPVLLLFPFQFTLSLPPMFWNQCCLLLWSYNVQPKLIENIFLWGYSILQTFVYSITGYSSILPVSKQKRMSFLPHANCSVLQTGPGGLLSCIIYTGQSSVSSWSSQILMLCFLVTVSKMLREQKLG